MFDKNIQRLNIEVNNLKQLIKEKDKELRMQAIKIKELVYAATDTHREKIIKNDYKLLQSLASAASPNRHLRNTNSNSRNNISQDNIEKLDQHR